jgi:HlyD family secretion protein
MEDMSMQQSGDPRGYEPPRRGGMARTLAILAGLASLTLAGLAVALIVTPGRSIQIKLGSPSPPQAQASAQSTAPAAQSASGAQQPWVAAAPGRVEPRSGQLRLGTSLSGKVDAIPVAANDRVAEGEVLLRLEDKEARARLSAAEAEAAARKRERDAQPVTSGRESVSKAEDAVFSAERAVTSARMELDDAITANRKNASGTQGALSAARRRLADANEKLRQEQANYASAYSKANVPAPNRLEAALIASRAEVTLTESVLDKTRIRTPIAGKVLQINAKVGELVAPSEFPLAVVGDMSVVRVRAEVDEADVAKIKLGQSVYVRNNAYPGKEFDGKVVEIAPSLAFPKMGSRGARRATDVEVLEVVIDLEGSNVPLLAGMRVDTYFRR